MWISIFSSTTYLKDHLFHHWLFLAPFSNIHWPYVVVQSLSCVQLFATQWTTAHWFPCPSPSSRACSNSCVLSVMPSNHLILCHPLLLLLQSFPASGSFQMSQFFVSGGQNIGVSALASVLPTNIQNKFPLGMTGLISLQFKGLWESSPTPQFNSINSSVLSFLYSPTLTSIHDHWKNHSLD